MRYVPVVCIKKGRGRLCVNKICHPQSRISIGLIRVRVRLLVPSLARVSALCRLSVCVGTRCGSRESRELASCVLQLECEASAVRVHLPRVLAP